ncbi:MAG: hypothetical protein ACREA0_25765, partial [bacterium]
DEERIFGFYTVRTLNANTAEDAATAAIESVWSHPWLASSPHRNEVTDPPRVWAAEVNEIELGGENEKIGLIFYLADQQ